MYFCSECFSPLTEFDVNFNKNLTGKVTPEKCKCATCLTDVEHLREKKMKCVQYILAYVFMLVAICLGCIGYILFYKYRIDDLIKNDFVWELYNFAEMFFWANVLAHAVAYIVAVVFCLKGEDFEETYSETSCIKTTYNSSTNSYVTTSSTTSESDDGCWDAIGKFLTYPFWGIFKFVKCHKDINKRHTKEIVSAYNQAVKETKTYTMPQYNDVKRWYENRQKEYTASIKNIRSKYGYLGEEVVENKIKEVKKPFFMILSSYKLIFIAHVRRYNRTNDNPEAYSGLGECYFFKSTKNKQIIYRDYAVYIPKQEEVSYLFDLAEIFRPEIGNIHIYYEGKSLCGADLNDEPISIGDEA